MMTCAEFLAEFADYLDDSANADLKAKLESHLHECSACTVIVDTTRKTIQMVTEADSFEFPDAAAEPIIAKVMERVRGRSAKP